MSVCVCVCVCVCLCVCVSVCLCVCVSVCVRDIIVWFSLARGVSLCFAELNRCNLQISFGLVRMDQIE